MRYDRVYKSDPEKYRNKYIMNLYYNPTNRILVSIISIRSKFRRNVNTTLRYVFEDYRKGYWSLVSRVSS